VAQDVLHRIEGAFRAFFKHRAGYPRFKKFRESGSFTYPQAYNGSARPDRPRKRLFLSKIGNVPAVFHRPLPEDSRLKTCAIVREPDGKWFASMFFEEVVPLQNTNPPVVKAVGAIGIDLGLLSLINTSDGEKVEHPHFLRKSEKKLKHIQQDFSRKKRGSNNWFKARQRVASLHARVRRQRLDFNHKLSRKLTGANRLVVFEDLRVRNMVKNRSLAKSIHDSGWRELIRLTESKAQGSGSVVVEVTAAFSTQECFNCGCHNKVKLSVRKFTCGGCGRTHDRDVNAARVVLKRGLAQVGLDWPELKPVETGPLPLETTPGASPIVEPGTKCAVDMKALESHTFLGVGGCHNRSRRLI
jgi:putative transposase